MPAHQNCTPGETDSLKLPPDRPILHKCHKCESLLAFPEEKIDRLVACPVCKAAFRVPGIAGQYQATDDQLAAISNAARSMDVALVLLATSVFLLMFGVPLSCLISDSVIGAVILLWVLFWLSGIFLGLKPGYGARKLLKGKESALRMMMWLFAFNPVLAVLLLSTRIQMVSNLKRLQALGPRQSA